MKFKTAAYLFLKRIYQKLKKNFNHKTILVHNSKSPIGFALINLSITLLNSRY